MISIWWRCPQMHGTEPPQEDCWGHRLWRRHLQWRCQLWSRKLEIKSFNKQWRFGWAFWILPWRRNSICRTLWQFLVQMLFLEVPWFLSPGASLQQPTITSPSSVPRVVQGVHWEIQETMVVKICTLELGIWSQLWRWCQKTWKPYLVRALWPTRTLVHLPWGRRGRTLLQNNGCHSQGWIPALLQLPLLLAFLKRLWQLWKLCWVVRLPVQLGLWSQHQRWRTRWMQLHSFVGERRRSGPRRCWLSRWLIPSVGRGGGATCWDYETADGRQVEAKESRESRSCLGCRRGSKLYGGRCEYRKRQTCCCCQKGSQTSLAGESRRNFIAHRASDAGRYVEQNSCTWNADERALRSCMGGTQISHRSLSSICPRSLGCGWNSGRSHPRFSSGGSGKSMPSTTLQLDQAAIDKGSWTL